MLLSAPLGTGQSVKSLDLTERIGAGIVGIDARRKLVCVNTQIARCYLRHHTALDEEVKPLIAQRDSILSQLDTPEALNVALDGVIAEAEADVEDVIAQRVQQDIDGDVRGLELRGDKYVQR